MQKNSFKNANNKKTANINKNEMKKLKHFFKSIQACRVKQLLFYRCLNSSMLKNIVSSFGNV